MQSFYLKMYVCRSLVVFTLLSKFELDTFNFLSFNSNQLS